MFNKGFFPPENGTVYEIIRKNVVEPIRSQITILLRRKHAVIHTYIYIYIYDGRT
jgi:hypothetical protein